MQNSIITYAQVNVAGSSTAGSSGDGGKALNAQLNHPQGLTGDTSGNLYIADTNNNKIRLVSRAGIISTIVGMGMVGSSGDGGAAIAAQLNSPIGVAIDGFGNMYIVDSNNNKIRMVSTSTSIITTIAGTGISGHIGDGGSAISAQLNSPQGIALDTVGNLYIADGNNEKIRLVTSAGIITTYAGTGTYGASGDGGPATSALLGYPQSVAWHTASSSLYIAADQKVRLVNSAGIITTFAGTGAAGYSGDGGPATNAKLYTPWAVALDAKGR